MANERSHFEIPKGNVRNEPYEKTGGGESFQRINHAEHGKKLKEQTYKLKQVELNRKDALYTSDLFFQLETPSELSVKGEKLKIEKLGFEVINFSKENKSIGIAKISKSALDDFEKRLDIYAESDEHTGKSYFSVIEDIVSVPVESKIKANVDFNSDEKIAVIINLYNALARKERLAINSTIIEEIRKYTDEVDQRTFSNGITSIACVLKAKEIPLIAQEFSTIKEIKPCRLPRILAIEG